MRPGNVEGLYATHIAERVIGRFGPELVARERILSREKSECFPRNDQMEKAQLRAHRAVALEDNKVLFGRHFESDGPAVTASCVSNHVACRITDGSITCEVRLPGRVEKFKVVARVPRAAFSA